MTFHARRPSSKECNMLYRIEVEYVDVTFSNFDTKGLSSHTGMAYERTQW